MLRMTHRLAFAVVALLLVLGQGSHLAGATSSSAQMSVSIEPATAAEISIGFVTSAARPHGVIRYTITVVMADGRCIAPTNCIIAGEATLSPGWRVSAALASAADGIAVDLPSGTLALVGISNLCRASDAPCSLPWDGGQEIDPVNGPLPTIAGVTRITDKQSLIAAAPGYGNGVYLFSLIVDVTVTERSNPASLVFTADGF